MKLTYILIHKSLTHKYMQIHNVHINAHTYTLSSIPVFYFTLQRFIRSAVLVHLNNLVVN